ncbi:MAG: glycine cleavage system aminomethyltransferase GcvT, partial [Verrucomicrobiae bacterium]|nr:glycine cleavage system aminomethyltransferase GcvT [Verrucomicrobiae bacterium]
MLKRTPLFEAHCRLGARLVEFGGWEMPLIYSGIVEEHHAVRRAAGVFDISHMGDFTATGPGAEAFLDHCLTNDVTRLAVGQGQYTLMCNERGGVIDDLYLFRVKPQEYLLVVNASRIAADWDWLETQVDGSPTNDGFHLRDDSANLAALAVQGPGVVEFIGDLIHGGSMAGTLVADVRELKKNQWGSFVFRGNPLGVARTGYTGEDGFEIVVEAGQAEALFETLLETGAPHGLKPVGLGARDTLRTEMGYPLYGHELAEDITPLEAGLGTFVALDKPDFIGRQALLEQKQRGLERRAIAFRMSARSAPPRPDYRVMDGTGRQSIGRVTSGTQSPSLETGIGLALVDPAHAAIGTPLQISIRDRLFPAEILRKPIYRREPS